VVAFAIEGAHPHDVATILDRDGICVRAGHHCAQPLMQHLGVIALARASFYVYTRFEDIDALAEGIMRVQQVFA
jgi:cysteine desulfurase/selenocysteine lyase